MSASRWGSVGGKAGCVGGCDAKRLGRGYMCEGTQVPSRDARDCEGGGKYVGGVSA